MALHQPAIASLQKSSLPEANTPSTAFVLPQQTPPENPQEWVLFPSSQIYSSSQSHTSFTAQSLRSAGLSRISDFGSLGAAARSGRERDGIHDLYDTEREDEELDSLDDGLQAFNGPSMNHSHRHPEQTGSILPTHDGLGTFLTSRPQFEGYSREFERPNPRSYAVRFQQRRLNVQRRLDAMNDQDLVGLKSERMERIERWRMDQSRISLDEIEKDTRKRIIYQTGERVERYDLAAAKEETAENGLDPPSIENQEPENNVKRDRRKQLEDGETLWETVVRRVLRDFLGIGDAWLATLIGKAHPGDEYFSGASLASLKPDSSISRNHPMWSSRAGWNSRLLDRLARELGILVQHITEHPGAFSTHFTCGIQDYASIPSSNPTASPIELDHMKSLNEPDPTCSPSLQFEPTLPNRQLRPSTPGSNFSQAAFWGVEDGENPAVFTCAAQDLAYWESTPDIKTVFRLLRTRFSAQDQIPTSYPVITTNITPDSLRRAAVIRQHHPLISRDRTRRYRNSLFHHHQYYHHSNPALSFKRADGSCANLSIRKAPRGSGSSRNYWDLGGSERSSGSAAAATMGIGSWAEV